MRKGAPDPEALRETLFKNWMAFLLWQKVSYTNKGINIPQNITSQNT